ncbi:MAG: hypothetical protein H8E03_00400 [Pelagibacteraceae bacterium]|nr:hypothetical protein [Pelagibacteraceae bacterium]
MPVTKIKKKKPTLNELILGVYLEALVTALKEGRKPDAMYNRLKLMIDEYGGTKKK